MSAASESFPSGINCLRISVTGECNLRCPHCIPPEGTLPSGEMLNNEEIAAVVRAAVGVGVNKIKLTGGEPLSRPGIVDLIQLLSDIEGVRDISMTTNGTLLAQNAEELAEAGLHRVNVSLDTLDPEKYRKMTLTGQLSDALKGIDAAIKAGLSPVKINFVAMKGMNDDEIVDFAAMSIEPGWHVRFIEPSPAGRAAEFVPYRDLCRKIVTLGTLEPYDHMSGAGAARYYHLPKAKGTIGFISPDEGPYCQDCKRMLLSPSGKLYPCLLSELSLDAISPLRKGAGLEAVKQVFHEAAAAKPSRPGASHGHSEG
jgi:cyclic pyranopterin phosphate synthase